MSRINPRWTEGEIPTITHTGEIQGSNPHYCKGIDCECHDNDVYHDGVIEGEAGEITYDYALGIFGSHNFADFDFE